MTYETMPLTYVNIYKGSRFSEAVNCTDEAGEPIPLLAQGDWAARAQFRTNYGEGLIATFDSAGGADGTITFDDLGNVTLSLPSTFTATLTATNAVQPSVYVGDLELWNTGTPNDRQRITDFRVRIYPEATTS